MNSTRLEKGPAERSFFRRVWSAGGRWEHLFLLLPGIWVLYAIAVVAWIVSSFQRFDVVIRFLTVAVSIVLLIDAWITPILSARVLRAIALAESSPPTSNTIVLAGYLESFGRNGRWIRGNLLSLGALFVIFMWSLVSIRFTELTGIEDDAIFFAVYVPFLVLLLWVYERELRRFFRNAAAQGFRLYPASRNSLTRQWYDK